MISPNTDLYWNVASPRAAVSVFGDEMVFRPIAPGFKQYGDRFQFIVGEAKGLDVPAQTVQLIDGQELRYDILVLTTGSRTKAPTVFKGVGSTEQVKADLQAFREQVRAAKTIVIAGGGPTGIELAGEIAFEFGAKKKVHLVGCLPNRRHSFYNSTWSTTSDNRLIARSRISLESREPSKRATTSAQGS